MTEFPSREFLIIDSCKLFVTLCVLFDTFWYADQYTQHFHAVSLRCLCVKFDEWKCCCLSLKDSEEKCFKNGPLVNFCNKLQNLNCLQMFLHLKQAEK